MKAPVFFLLENDIDPEHFTLLAEAEGLTQDQCLDLDYIEDKVENWKEMGMI